MASVDNPPPSRPSPPAPPTRASVAVSAPLVEALVQHAGSPNEMCGVIVGDRPAADGGAPLRWEPARNRAASPLRYDIHPDDLYRLTVETDDAGEVFWAIVHSHTHSAPRPSLTDIGLAFYADALYILVSLAESRSRRSRRGGSSAARSSGRAAGDRAGVTDPRDVARGYDEAAERYLEWSALRRRRRGCATWRSPRTHPGRRPGARAGLRRRDPDDRGPRRRAATSPASTSRRGRSSWPARTSRARPSSRPT